MAIALMGALGNNRKGLEGGRKYRVRSMQYLVSSTRCSVLEQQPGCSVFHPMRAHLRIVSGSLRGRKLGYTVHPGLRPIPDMVRQALFNILRDDIPDRPFLDLFAGTGVVGFEALSRGALTVEFVERDFHAANEIAKSLKEFGVADKGRLHRADVYRWVERWQAPAEPVTIFLGPPFPDLEHRPEALVQAIAELQEKAAVGSVLVVQSEKSFVAEYLANGQPWDVRRYSRNQLALWRKPVVLS
jgi:16S rRNA (guanine966-N2)-methyltransferase